MSNYKLEHKATSNTSTRARYGHGSKILGVTIHHWGSDGQKHDNVVRWLRGRNGGVNNRNSSAHYVVSAGRVTQLAADSVATWHSGNNKGNGTTIGIECRPEMSAGDWATLVELCADLEEKHGSLRYWKHKDWKNTDCPGRYSNKLGDLVKAVNAERKRRKGGKGSTSSAAPKPGSASKRRAPAFPLPRGHWYGVESKDPRNHSGYWERDRAGIKQWQQQMKRRGWRINATGRFDQRSRTVARAFQKEKGLRVDGGLGRETWTASWEAPVT